MGKSTKKLLVFFIILLLALAALVVFKGSGAGVAAAGQQSRTAELEKRVKAIKDINFTGLTQKMAGDLTADFEAHGNVPVQAGEVGRANPFGPY